MDTSNSATTWRWVIGTIVAAAAVIAIVWTIQHTRVKSGVVGAQSTSTASTSKDAGASDTASAAGTDSSVGASVASSVSGAVSAVVGGTATGGSLSVNNQAAGNTVAISGMSLSANSWVAIKDKNGWYLGAAWFPAGSTQGSVKLLRTTKAGETYTAVIFADDGSKTFDFHKEQQVTTSDGMAVSATFVAQ